MHNSAGLALDARNIVKIFRGRGTARGEVRAVNGVSLQVPRGANLGILGESGSGKSTLARCLTRLIEPDAGEIYISAQPEQPPVAFHTIKGAELARTRRKIQLIFQDPGLSLDPRLRVREIVAEALPPGGDPDARAREWITRAGLPAAAGDRLPRALSGGERQRVAIARALAADPCILILDESTAALDVSVRAGILHLLLTIQKDLNLTYLWISHDIPLVLALCDRAAVMRDGVILEEIDSARARRGEAVQEYTRNLLKAAAWPPPSGGALQI